MACELELWQEAFRSVEDIQGLLSQSKKAPKPQMMATYYAKLTKIFTVSDSHLYNGYAWYISSHRNEWHRLRFALLCQLQFRPLLPLLGLSARQSSASHASNAST